MEIKDLKQPYKRMAEYLVTQNCIQEAGDGIYNFYKQGSIMDLFWNSVDKGNHPPITEEIKKHFPDDFDFSGEEIVKRRKMKKNNYPTRLNIETIKKIIENYKKGLTQVQSAEIIGINNGYLGKILHYYLGNEKAKQKVGIAVSRLIEQVKNAESSFVIEKQENELYTQLAKEGKFDELPDTCEFSEPVELEVWDNELSIPVRTNVLGKFKSRYVTEGNLCWKYAKVPTQKIDFSEFKAGDVVEVLTKSQGFFWGMFSTNETDFIRLTFGTESGVTKHIYKDQINLITKIK